MEAVTGATSSLLPKLGALLQDEYKLQDKVKRDIESLQNELVFMNATLRMVAEAPREEINEHVRIWAGFIRELSYDMEDTVNTFLVARVHDAPHMGGVINGLFNMFCMGRTHHRIAGMIEEIKSLIKELSELRDRYRLDSIVNNLATAEQGFVFPQLDQYDAAENQKTSLELIGTKKPVGVDKEMDELRKWVTLQQQLPATSSQDPPSFQTEAKRHNHGVLSIVGFGGVGKTTIAMALYRKFGDQFERRAMVTVSQSSNIEAILQNILTQVMPQSKDGDGQQGGSGGGASEKNRLMAAIGTIWNPVELHTSEQTMKLERLKEELAKHLKKYSYLLLVDDVWSELAWEQIRKSLPQSERGSRIIVTTRFQAIASGCRRDKGDYVHKVGVLSADKPKELFMEVMAESRFNKEDEEKQKNIPLEVVAESKFNKEYEEKQKIPSRIWEMCGGLPLALVTMAGLVACNPHRSEEEWNKVCNALVPASVKSLTQDGITRIISHCYNDLPREIKTCLLYLCIFPKGRKISRKRLMRRWLAEGFVSEKQGLSLEDVAETYFNHLIKRKIIRAVEHSSNGKVKSYQVHDMVVEYIISNASEENFIMVVGNHWHMVPPSNKVRRLSLQGGDYKDRKTMEILNLSHVRSLTLFGSLNQLPSSLKFGIVQVLDLEDCKDFKQHHAKEICKMLLLKYICLRRTDIKKLPKEIGNLQYLETLDIRETNVTELPKTVCQIERLMNILGGNKRTRKALKLPEDLKKKRMSSMRILSGIEILEETGLSDFHHMTDLRKLAIYKLNMYEGSRLFRELWSSIEYLGGYSLCTLVIDDESSEFLKLLGALSSPPRFLNSLELFGKLVELPKWIPEMNALTKLTVSVTALRADNLKLLSEICSLFSLTFSLNAANQDQEIASIIADNKAHSNGEILFPIGGSANLKLLRFFAPFVPQLSFPDGAAPALERIDLRFSNFEAVVGIERLQNLQEVHIRVHDKASDITKSIIEEMATAAKEDHEGARIIFD